ncbi:MAG: ATP-grasp domain-containing protein [Gammaproteobacteria bacterium]
MKVLVTGAGALLGQGIIHSLRRSSLRPYIISVDPSSLSAGLYWTDRPHLVPLASDPHYIDHLRELLQIEKPDAVLVGTDLELPIFAEHRGQLEGEFSTHVLVSEPHVVDTANDKYKTYEFLRDAGFDPPASCLPGEESSLIDRVGFPLIVKPRIGARSVGVGLVRDRSELRSALSRPGGLIIQECAGPEDQEYTASALVFEGRCRATIVMRRDLRDGNTYRAYVEEFPDLNRAVRRLGEALRPYGPANFQFRVNREGRVKVFEINARFSGTTPLRAHAGFNEIEMCLRHVLLGQPLEQPMLEEMTILRHWSETVVRPGDLRAIT